MICFFCWWFEECWWKQGAVTKKAHWNCIFWRRSPACCCGYIDQTWRFRKCWRILCSLWKCSPFVPVFVIGTWRWKLSTLLTSHSIPSFPPCPCSWVKWANMMSSLTMQLPCLILQGMVKGPWPALLWAQWTAAWVSQCSQLVHFLSASLPQSGSSRLYGYGKWNYIKLCESG